MSAKDLASQVANRKDDWRIGPVVYQIIVDRFAPSNRLESKRTLYDAPRKLLAWGDPIPKKGMLPNGQVSRPESVFYGGDLESLQGRLDYLQELGVDLVYLNPIFEAFTNHKYDAITFDRVDPQYGNNEELGALADKLHRRGMRLMLDGVFNHMGMRSHWFSAASENGPTRESEFFTLSEDHPNGYLCWRNHGNLPELRLENREVRKILWENEDSVVRRWLRDYGVDGWRLDVAPDIGPEYLRAITEASHETKPGSAVIGECWNYPERWFESVDGILNMYMRTLILELVEGRTEPLVFRAQLEDLLKDCPMVGLLMSHNVLDNHDLPRLANVIPSKEKRFLARFLQFTLPGCPVIYYGSELGMNGGGDPYNRAPMDWPLLQNNEELAFMKELIRLRQELPALQFGDLRTLPSGRLHAFQRITGNPRKTVIAVFNCSEEERADVIPVRDSYLMDCLPLKCLLSGETKQAESGIIRVTLPPLGVRTYCTEPISISSGYNLLKRIP